MPHGTVIAMIRQEAMCGRRTFDGFAAIATATIKNIVSID
jgi:hypothetical protein